MISKPDTIAQRLSRDSTPEGTALSRSLREGTDGVLRRRRSASALTLVGIGSLSVVALYQMGILKHVPEPRLRFLDADSVDASGEAYSTLEMPDAALGILSYSMTLALAAYGGADRSVTRPWIPLLLAAKVVLDAVAAAALTIEQATRHRACCSWCLLAAGASFATVPAVVPEAGSSLRRLLSEQTTG